MAKKCIRLYVGDDGEPREIDEVCDTDHGMSMPIHHRKLSPPKFALYKAAAYFTAATVIPSITMQRPRDVNTPEVEASFIVEIITADKRAWENALDLADDLRIGLQQKAVRAIMIYIADTALVEM